MKKYTFSDLLQKKCFDFSRIEIPLLQRDYVQGQKENADDMAINKTGYRFITEIFNSMKTKTVMDMDFIYGAVEKDNKFTPLDGQQRLTTLFLLHLYFACKDFTGKELEEKMSMLSSFSYETRISSRDFCIELCKLKKNFASEEKPSDYLRNESWFFNKYNLDPTVSSMLNMLDVIHNLDSKDNLSYEHLNFLQFNVLNMPDFGLTEELYLKMNARGKLLTEFEKIKAELEKKASDSNWEDAIGEEEKFYYKADRSWTDLFWAHFKTSIDDAFLNFMAEVVIIELALQSESLESESGKKSVRRIQKIAENSENLSVEDINKNVFNGFKHILDLYCLTDNATKRPSIDLWDFCEEQSSFFSTVCKMDEGAEVTYPVRGLFYAQTLYLEKAKFSEEHFNDWMRVVRNIAENIDIDSVQTFKGFLNLISEFSEGCEDIYKYLSTHQMKSNFAKSQVQEEIYKAKIIVKEEAAKKLFSELEENPFFTGRLYFAFYCCGMDLSNDSSELDLKLFKKIKVVFDNNLSGDDISDDFRVLLFTCGNNRFYEYWGTWSYKTETNKRRCIGSLGDLYWNFSCPDNPIDHKDVLKEAILKLSKGTSVRQLISDFKCPDEMPKWEKWIIKHPDEFSEHCSSHYFGITPDNKTCYLYEGYIRPNKKSDCFKIPIK